jgi:D-alanyl-D-alanine carboxypeptidase/D-alanyl-D-alanine-endopeptidase (penicillin-binding protein 4)
MIRLLSTSAVLLLAAASSPGEGDPGLRRAVNDQVAAARRVAPELGVSVVDAASGETAYSFNPDTPRILASNTKLFTTAAALDRLGPGFFFETAVLGRGEVRGGTLAGDLAVVGGGDPHLSGRQYFGDSFGAFREWAAALRALGIERVAGDVLLVHGYFDDERVHPDWPRDQLTRWYEAPVEALSFNDNCVLVRVAPDGGPGRPARVEVVPPLPYFTVESSAVTSAESHWVAIGRRSGADSHVLTAGGRVRIGAEPVDKWVAVDDPLRYFGAALVAALAEEGVAAGGEARPVTALEGEGWRPLHTHRTDLLTVLEVVNKRSQNFYAESVLKLLGAELCGDGSWPGGIRAVAEVLAEAGIDAGSYALADGSGMSRGNRFTPRQVTLLLTHMFHHRWGAEFVRTLPHSGEADLRWEKRLAQPPYRGNVMAKTGYLAGVSTLSGYAKALSGKVYAFAILANGIAGEAAARKAQDRIVRALIDHG